MKYFNLLFKEKLKTSVISLLIIYISANIINLYGDILPSNFIFFNKIFVVIIFAFFIIDLIFNKIKFLAPGIFGFYVFITYSLILFIINDFSYYSIYYSLGIIYNYIGFLIIINLLRSKTDLKIFSFIYLLIVGLGCVIYLYNWFILGNWGILRPSNVAVTGGNINANIVSGLMVICIMVAEYLFKDLKKKWYFILYAIYLVFLIGVFGLGSRFMSIITLIFLCISIYNKLKFKYLLFILSLLVFIIIMNSPLFMEFTADIKSINRIINSGLESERLSDLILNFKYFLESPLFGQSIEKIFITYDGKISHIVYLNYLVEGGLFGYFFLLIFFFSIFKKKLLKLDHVGKMFLIFWLSFYFWSPSYWIMLVPASYVYLNNYLK